MSGKARLERLLEPFHIGKVQTRNRMLKAGAGTSFIEKNGYVGETMKGFYVALAKGGVGLLIVESTGVDYPLGIHHGEVQCHLDDDKYIPSYAELTRVIYHHNCPVFIQLFHSGPWHPTRWMGLQPIAASSLTKSELPYPNLDEPRGLSIPEIHEVINKFVNTAERAQKAGFDGIEINASSAHLINSFLSRVWNRREDIYGCKDLETRSRFLVEIIREIKKRLGHDFPVSVLLTGIELGIEKGTTIEEAQGFGRILQEAGVDAIQVRAFGYGEYTFIHPGPEQILYPEPPQSVTKALDWSRKGAGAFVPLAEAIKKVVSIPVITVGRLDPELGEQVLKQGKADFIALNRRLLADPELPNKVSTGRMQDIVPCTACLYCWYKRRQNLPIKCRVNAALGKEQEYAIQPAQKQKTVLVVGGGPAGMEAARIAALRGHNVTLFEKENKLGGLLNLAAVVKEAKIENLMCIVRYLKNQLIWLNVDIKLRKTVNLSEIQELNPDVVVLAVGGSQNTLQISGINNRNVLQGSELHRQLKFYLRFSNASTLKWLTRLWMPVRKNVVVIGGSLQGCQLAEFLVKRGRKVTIVEAENAIGEGIYPEEIKTALLSWLVKKDATLIPEVKYREITDKGLIIVTKTGETKIIEADTILTAPPLVPNTELLKAIRGKVPEVYAIGDCLEPRLSADAVADGSYIARKF